MGTQNLSFGGFEIINDNSSGLYYLNFPTGKIDLTNSTIYNENGTVRNVPSINSVQTASEETLIIGKSYVVLSYKFNSIESYALLDVAYKQVRFAGGVEVSLLTNIPVEGCGGDKVVMPGTNIAVNLLNRRITTLKCGSYYSGLQSDAKIPSGLQSDAKIQQLRILGGVNNNVSFK